MHPIAYFLPQPLEEVFLSEIREVSKTINTRRPRPPRRRPDIDPFVRCADSAEKGCIRILRMLDPANAVALWFEIRESVPEIDTLSNVGILESALWALGAAGGGASTDTLVMQRYFRLFGRWWAAKSAIVMFEAMSLEDFDEALPATTAMAFASADGREFQSRIASGFIRFRWIAREVSAALVKEIEEAPEFAALLPDFTDRNLKQLELGIDMYGSRLLLLSIDDGGARIAQHLSVAAGSLAGTELIDLATSNIRSERPWIRFQDALVPVALRTANLEIESGLLAAVDRILLSSKLPAATKGELFERTAQQLILEALGHGYRGPQRPATLACGVAYERADDRDVDFAAIAPNSGSVIAIGEVKAKSRSKKTRSALEAFMAQIDEVSEQISLRLDALEKGSSLKDGHGREYTSMNPVLGLGILLHGYGGNLTDSRTMSALPNAATRELVAILDIHSWIIVLNMFDSPMELQEYLRFRFQLRELSVIAMDEADLAIAYLSGPERTLSFFRSTLPKSKGQESVRTLNGCFVSAKDSIETLKPSSSEGWRATLYSVAENNTIFEN